MSMAVVDVRKVRVAVHHGLVRMRMRVRFARRIVRRMRMAMMLVVDVPVAVSEQLVPVAVLVTLGQV